MTSFNLFILILATWYLSYALVNKHGAFGMFDKLREFKGGRWHGRNMTRGIIDTRINEVGGTDFKLGDIVKKDGLLDCIICTSVWVAFALCMASGDNNLIDVCAVAGGACLLHSYSGWRVNM